MRIRLPELSATQMYYQLNAAMDMELHSMVTPHIHPQMEWQHMIDLIVRYNDSLRMKKNPQSNSYPRNNYNNKSVPSTKTEETLGTTNLTGIEIRNLGNHRRNRLLRTTTGNRRTTTNLKRKRIY